MGFLVFAVRSPDFPSVDHFTQVAGSRRSFDTYPLPPHTRDSQDQGNRVLVFDRQFLAREDSTSDISNQERKASEVLNLIDFRQTVVQPVSQGGDESSIVWILGILGAFNDTFPIDCRGASRHLSGTGYVGAECSHHREVMPSRSPENSEEDVPFWSN